MFYGCTIEHQQGATISEGHESRPGWALPKIWVGVFGPLPKTLTLFMTKICDFPYPFYDQNRWFSLSYLWPIYDLTKNSIPYLWPDTLVVNKMAAKWLKSIPYLWPKRLKNHTLWSRTYLYSPYKGVPPPPRESRHFFFFWCLLYWSPINTSRSIFWSTDRSLSE